jgi:hypothetical protein
MNDLQVHDMPRKTITKKNRCYRVMAGILLTGLGSALAIYLTAAEIPENPFAEYEQSKRFSHEVQRVGGKLALVANDLAAWFGELWQGRRLAFTVACMTLMITAGYYFIAGGAVPEDEGDRPPE